MNKYPGSNLDILLIRQTTFAVILQGLLHVVAKRNLITEADRKELRDYALNLARDMVMVPDAQTRAAGVRIEEEIESFLEVVFGTHLSP